MKLSGEAATFLVMEVMASYIKKLADDYDIDLDQVAAEVTTETPEGSEIKNEVRMGELIHHILER